MRIVSRAFQLAQAIARGEQAHQRPVQRCFVGLAAIQRLAERAIGVAAVQIVPRVEGGGAGAGFVGAEVMEVQHVVERIAVGHHEPAESPVLAQAAIEQPVGGAGRRAVQRVVGAHHRAGAAFDQRGTERRQVGRLQIARGDIHVETVTPRLRTAVHSQMLWRGDRARMPRIVALQAADESDRQLPGEVGILAVGFHATSPAGVAENVDVRRPDRQPFITPMVAAGSTGQVELGTRLGRGHRADLFQKLAVPGRRQPDGLRKHRRVAAAGDAVQTLVPPLVGRHAQARNRRSGVHRLRDFLLARHLRHQRRRTLLGLVRVYRRHRRYQRQHPPGCNQARKDGAAKEHGHGQRFSGAWLNVQRGRKDACSNARPEKKRVAVGAATRTDGMPSGED